MEDPPPSAVPALAARPSELVALMPSALVSCVVYHQRIGASPFSKAARAGNGTSEMRRGDFLATRCTTAFAFVAKLITTLAVQGAVASGMSAFSAIARTLRSTMVAYSG